MHPWLWARAPALAAAALAAAPPRPARDPVDLADASGPGEPPAAPPPGFAESKGVYCRLAHAHPGQRESGSAVRGRTGGGSGKRAERGAAA
eukprot:gene15674-12384_t